MKKFICLLILLTPLTLKAAEPTVLINEIAWMGTQTSANDEWLELYNPTESDVDLTGWKLQAADGSPEVNLTGTISAGSYFLFERTDDDTVPGVSADQIYTGALGNTSEHLKLHDAKNNLIDEINASDGWPGGDNSTKQTLERASTNRWQTSAEPGGTPRAQNSRGSDSEPPAETPTSTPATEDINQGDSGTTNQSTTKKGDVIFNELLPNPNGDDTKDEFIELKNMSAGPVDLTNWQITNAAKQTFTLPSLTVQPKIIVVFYRGQTGLALNNAKDKLVLTDVARKIIDQAEYKSLAPEGQSYQKNISGKLSWQEPSPGKENIFEDTVYPVAIINGPKEAEAGKIITFDSSDSFDPENRELNFFWNFGDGRTDRGILVRQIYLAAGNYEVKLNVFADQNASTTEIFKIKITGPQKEKISQATATTTPTTTPPLTVFAEMPFIFISEFLPNPQGSDDQEFIEIFSNDEKPVSLAGWQLDDAEGGSKPYAIPEGTIIKPGQYLAFWRDQTKIALNNSDEVVRLFAPDGTLVDYTDYEESKEGKSFVLDERFVWRQTQTPTPGEINVLDEEPESEVLKKESAEAKPEVLGAETKGEIIENAPKNKNKYIFSAISAAVIIGIGGFLKIKKR